MKVPTVVPLTRGGEAQAISMFGTAPRTIAVPVLPPDADDDAWLARRREGVGASETAQLLGCSPHGSYFSLWWQKHEGWDLDVTDSMRVGTMSEDIVATLFRERHTMLLVVRPGARLWAHHSYPWMLATPDYLAVSPVFEERGNDVFVSGVEIEPVECKTDQGGKGWGDPFADPPEVPEHHRVQVIQQCAVFGARRGHLVRWANGKLTTYVIDFDDAARARFDSWAQTARRFLTEVETDVSPDPDGHTATSETLIRLFPGFDEGKEVLVPESTAVDFLTAEEEYAVALRVREQARNALRLAMTDGQFAIDPRTGSRVATRLVYKRRGYEVAPCVIDQLRKS